MIWHYNSGKKVEKMQLTLVSEPWFCIRPNSTKRFYDLCMQRILVLILRVFQERSQLHFHSFQQLKIGHRTVILWNVNIAELLKRKVHIAHGWHHWIQMLYSNMAVKVWNEASAYLVFWFRRHFTFLCLLIPHFSVLENKKLLPPKLLKPKKRPHNI